MLNEYFFQFGVIIFPICVYQIVAFGRSFNLLPFNTWVLGIYGGGAGILCQLMPVHILGQPENFQCVPIILSILYGKRRAGLLSVAILSVYQWMTVDTYAPSILAILIYSAVPFAICTRFGRLNRSQRFWTATMLSVVTLVVELLFILCFFIWRFRGDGLGQLAHYVNYIAIACVIQLVLMALAFFLLENIMENGRIRNRHESMIAYNPLGIGAFDMNNRFVAVNAAYEAITGYTEEELLGNSRLLLWFEEDLGKAESMLRHAMEGEIKQDVETILRHKSGRQIPIRFTAVPMREGGEIVGYFSMIRDVTEVAQAEEVLRNAEKLSAIGQLAAGVAHEIRNPLTSIKGFLQLMAKTCDPKQSRYYEIVMSELLRIEAIVSEMLVLAKPQAVIFRSIGVKEKLEEVTALIAAEANLQNVVISIDARVTGAQLLGDGNQIKQVFLNIAKNALDAMPNGGGLRISLDEQDGQIVLRFSDDGHGIPQEALDKLGEPFYSTKTKGTGLGFLVSKRIISSHNGSIRIESTLNKGTTVTLTFPSYREDAAVRTEDRKAPA